MSHRCHIHWLLVLGVCAWGLSLSPALAITLPPALARGRPVSAPPPAAAATARPAGPTPSDAASFEHYAVILARMPFGDEQAAAAAVAAAAAAAQPRAESFAKNLKMSAITRNRFSGRVQIGLANTATKKSYFLYEGDSEDGIELLKADYENEKALLKKGDEEVWLDMNAATVVAVAARSAPPPAVSRRGLRGPSVATPPAEPPKTVFKTNEALEKHLKEYQMDLIRAGGDKGPPLPMELTPEMDDQLVSEGVLPPAE